MIISPEFTNILVGFAIIGGWIGVAFLWWLYRADPLHGWLLYTLSITSTSAMVIGTYLGWIAGLRVTGGLAAVPEWTGILTTIATLALCGIPIWKAWQFWRNGRG